MHASSFSLLEKLVFHAVLLCGRGECRIGGVIGEMMLCCIAACLGSLSASLLPEIPLWLGMQCVLIGTPWCCLAISVI